LSTSDSRHQLKWAFNSATIMHCPWEEELRLWEEFGWRAAEIWGSKIQPRLDAGETTHQLSRQMADAGVTPIGLCAGFLSADPAAWDKEREGLSRNLDLTQAMGAPSLTVVIVGGRGEDIVEDYRVLAKKLRDTADLGQERGVRINLEFLGGLPLNGTLGSGIELVNRVDHSHLGLLLDFCHYYASSSHIEELELLAPDKLFVVHVDDAQRKPMEALSNEDRTFPGEGRINLPVLFQTLHRYGFNGYYSVELYDKGIWALPPREVMTRLRASLTQLESQMDLS